MMNLVGLTLALTVAMVASSLIVMVITMKLMTSKTFVKKMCDYYVHCLTTFTKVFEEMNEEDEDL